MDEKNRRIKELELEVENEKMEQKKQLDLLDQEVILIPLYEWIIGLKWPCYSNNSIASYLNYLYSNKLLQGCKSLACMQFTLINVMQIWWSLKLKIIKSNLIENKSFFYKNDNMCTMKSSYLWGAKV